MNLLNKTHLFARSLGAVGIESSIAFDALISEQHESQLTLTDYPVESGAPITDHSYKENETLTLTVGHGIGAFETSNIFGPGIDSASRLSTFYDDLQTAQAAGELFDVGTGIKLYESMVIQGLSVIRDKANTTIMTITISLREVRIVDINDAEKFIERYDAAGGIRDRASTDVNRGNVSTEDITDTAEERETNQSLLDRGIVGGIRFFTQ